MNATDVSTHNKLIRTETDSVVILSKLRNFSLEIGFSDFDVTRILTSASELTRNIIKYASAGNIRYSKLVDGTKIGLELIASDSGPGIPNLDEAMSDNFSTSGTLGLGLPGVKRMVDEFELKSEVGVGTEVSFKVWKR